MKMKQPVLVASGISKSFQASRGLFKSPLQIQALENISFSLSAAETLAVVGETGSGKTTLARILTGLDQMDEGLILFNGKNVSYKNSKQRKQLQQSIRLIFQNPGRTLNPKLSIGDTLLLPLRASKKIPAHEYQPRLLAILQQVGLRIDQGDWYPHMFSGGQQQRIAIARALISEPEVVVADEPLSALDVSVQAQVTNLLLDLQQEIGISYIFISHNLSIVKHISDKILVMFAGQMVEFGFAKDIFANPQHPYTRTLLASTPGLGKNYPKQWLSHVRVYTRTVSHEAGCPYVNRCAYSSEKCILEKPPQVPIQNQIISCHKAGEL